MSMSSLMDYGKISYTNSCTKWSSRWPRILYNFPISTKSQTHRTC